MKIFSPVHVLTMLLKVSRIIPHNVAEREHSTSHCSRERLWQNSVTTYFQRCICQSTRWGKIIEKKGIFGMWRVVIDASLKQFHDLMHSINLILKYYIINIIALFFQDTLTVHDIAFLRDHYFYWNALCIVGYLIPLWTAGLWFSKWCFIEENKLAYKQIVIYFNRIIWIIYYALSCH